MDCEGVEGVTTRRKKRQREQPQDTNKHSTHSKRYSDNKGQTLTHSRKKNNKKEKQKTRKTAEEEMDTQPAEHAEQDSAEPVAQQEPVSTSDRQNALENLLSKLGGLNSSFAPNPALGLAH